MRPGPKVGPRPVVQLPDTERARLERTVRELRDRGLSYPSICVVLELYEGVTLTEVQMRRWFRNLGYKMPGKRACAVASGWAA